MRLDTWFRLALPLVAAGCAHDWDAHRYAEQDGHGGSSSVRSSSATGAAAGAGGAGAGGASCVAGGTPGALEAPCISTHSLYGNYFDVHAELSEVRVTGFEPLAQACTACSVCDPRDVEVYSKADTYVGFEHMKSAWTLRSSVTNFQPVNCAHECGSYQPTPLPPPFCVSIPQGKTVAFYIVVTGGSGNTTFESSDLATGMPVVQNNDVALYSGAAQDMDVGAFAGVLVPDQAWVGILQYER